MCQIPTLPCFQNQNDSHKIQLTTNAVRSSSKCPTRVASRLGRSICWSSNSVLCNYFMSKQYQVKKRKFTCHVISSSSIIGVDKPTRQWLG
ncbi:hypothetical protein Hanom_Chr09g00760811 [Helianthus anomalus]